ncbi:hypothetical protein DL98DRAFT_654798 [Cadophora sp. DSE1049]|nr:hypothetical protein DL98DRAFT_654798 [Cadophora sp. DSE1049]
MNAPPPPATMRCAACAKLEVFLPAPLKACGRCKRVRYCSIECQKTDWKSHKLACATQTSTPQPPGASSSVTFSASVSISGSSSDANPTLSRVLNDVLGLGGQFFTNRHTKGDVFSQLIDAFRLRIADEIEYKYKQTGLSPDTIASLLVSQAINHNNTRMGDIPIAGTGFDAFLDLAENTDTVMPVWWSKQLRDECFALATGADAWFDLKKKVDKDAIAQHYGNPSTPMILRILAERVYGKGVF